MYGLWTVVFGVFVELDVVVGAEAESICTYYCTV